MEYISGMGFRWTYISSMTLCCYGLCYEGIMVLALVTVNPFAVSGCEMKVTLVDVRRLTSATVVLLIFACEYILKPVMFKHYCLNTQ